MSRWLSSVNTLLTQLDGQAEIAVEEHLLQTNAADGDGDDDDGLHSGGDAALDSILAKRGLSFMDGDEDGDVDAADENADVDAGINANTDDGWDASASDFDFDNDDQGANDTTADKPVDVSTQDSQTQIQVEGMATQPAETAEADKELNVGEDQGELQSEQQQSANGTAEASNNNSNNNSNNKVSEGDQRDSDPSQAGDVEKEDGAGDVDASTGFDQNQKGASATNTSKPVPPTPPPGPPAARTVVTETKQKAQPKPSSPAPAFSTPPPSKAMPKNPMRPPSSHKQTPTGTANMIAKSDFVQVQKEARTLRRHVVSLNSQLEAAESELKAQRGELEQAADRMEKDRTKNKKQLEDMKQLHAKQMAAKQKQHEDILMERQAKLEQEQQQYRMHIADLESRRQQEGGDWNKELTSAVDKHRESEAKITSLEDERLILLSQISTLQAQQETLGSRLESLTQTSDNAMDREREAEERLDAMLTQHAHQIAQRQAREAELEKTVHELGAALVAARASTGGASASALADPSKANGVSGEGDTAAGDPVVDSSMLKSKVQTLEQDLSNAHSQLDLERERSQALHKQLKDLSKETTQEASAVHARQIQNDRQIADLNLTVSRLQADLRHASNDVEGQAAEAEASTMSRENGLAKEVQVLSEEVLRLRTQMGNQNSEVITLKNRVKSANERANQAENDLAMALANSKNMSDSAYDTMERDSAPMSGTGLSRRRRNANSSSIRSAIQLHPGHGDRAEQIGKAIDVVDDFAVSTGKYLRRNPLARAGFLMYLVLIHTWSFVLLFFHAHSFENIHGDFGAGVGAAHGPHALMEHSENVVKLPPVTPEAEPAAAADKIKEAKQAAPKVDAQAAADDAKKR